MNEFWRCASGRFRRHELRRYVLFKAFLFWGLIGLAWWTYPRENAYSPRTHTFSFLGSFNEEHTPQWWWIFSIAMVFWGVAMTPLALYHFRRFRPISRVGAAIGTGLFLIGSLGIILVGLFPDAKPELWGDWRWTDVHERAAILTGIGFALGIPWHAGLLLRDWLGQRHLGRDGRWQYRRMVGPYALWSTAVGLAVYFQLTWDSLYKQMKAAAAEAGVSIGSSWAEGLHTRYSFPLWENIVVYTLFAFLVWFSLALAEEDGTPAP